MSFLFSPSTSSTSASADLQKLKASATHLADSSVVRISRSNGKNGKSSKQKMVSKAFNNVAARPISRQSYKEQIITCNMRLDFIGAITSSTTASVFGGVAVALNQFTGYLEYVGLFDQYRFNQLEMWLEPQQSQSTSMSNTGLLTSAIDLDDAAAPTSYATIEDKQTSLTTSGLDGHYHKWSPHIAVAAYSGAFTSFSNAPAQWIDSGSSGVQHYGLKYAITSTSAAITYNLTVRASVSFKQPGI